MAQNTEDLRGTGKCALGKYTLWVHQGGSLMTNSAESEEGTLVGKRENQMIESEWTMYDMSDTKPVLCIMPTLAQEGLKTNSVSI